jgi:hypothetical protein
MNSQTIKKLLLTLLGGAAVASCAPIKTGFAASDLGQVTSINSVAQFDSEAKNCPDAKAEASIVADADGNAFLTRSGCEELGAAEPIQPDELQSSPSGEEVIFRNDLFERNEESGESRAEVPRENTEVPRENTEVPRENTEVPHVNTEVPRTNTEEPHVNTEVPQSNLEGERRI